VFVEAVRPPTAFDGAARVRLAAMATHTRSELRAAARVIGRAALRVGARPAVEERGPFDHAAVELPRAA
jgi:hypothetical protein